VATAQDAVTKLDLEIDVISAKIEDLRKLIAKDEIVLKRQREEIETLEPLRIIAVVDSDLLLKRNQLLQNRLNELKALPPPADE
jgi:hypothetical protein